MPLNNHKIINLPNPIVSLPDHPSAEGMTAEQIKTAFDKSPNEIKDKLNALIDNLLSKTNGDSGADNIGSTAITGINGDTVQRQLESLKTFIDAAILGYINDGTITDAKLSNAPGQVKERLNSFAPHLTKLATEAGGVHGLQIEKGIFTPYIYGQTVAGNHQYNNQDGWYVKYNNIIHAGGRIRLNTKDGNMSGSVSVGGFPFPYVSYSVGVIYHTDLQLGDFSGLSLFTNASRFDLAKSGSSKAFQTVNAVDILNNTALYFEITYLIN